MEFDIKNIFFWSGKFRTENTPPDAFQDTGLGVFRLAVKNYRSLRILRSDNSIVWDVQYEIDSKYFRRVSLTEQSKKSHDLRGFIMLGDSRIFGEGLSDRDTLTTKLGQLIKNNRFYNYSLPGLFPGEALDRVRLISGAGYNQEIQESKNALVYFYSPYQIYRSVASFNHIANGGYKRPFYYQNEKSEIVQKETVQSVMPFRSWLSDVFVQSRIFRKHRLDWPKVTESDWLHFISILKQIRQNSYRFGVDKFYVIIYPDYDPTTLDLIQHLEKAKIPYISYAHWRIQNLSSKPVLIENEGHPNGEFNSIFAQALSAENYLFKD